MSVPIEIKIESARGEIINTVERMSQEYGLPAVIIDGILSSVLEDIRNQEKLGLAKAFNKIQLEKNAEIENLEKELKKAKAAAKKVLKQDTQETMEEDQEGDGDDGRDATDH